MKIKKPPALQPNPGAEFAEGQPRSLEESPEMPLEFLSFFLETVSQAPSSTPGAQKPLNPYACDEGVAEPLKKKHDQAFSAGFLFFGNFHSAGFQLVYISSEVDGELDILGQRKPRVRGDKITVIARDYIRVACFIWLRKPAIRFPRNHLKVSGTRNVALSGLFQAN